MPEDFEEKSPESIDWDRYFGIIRRRAWYFMVPMFVGWLAVWAVSWFLPSVYRSGTLILVEQPAVPTQFVVPNIAGDLQDRLQSITQQILSRTRLLHIIDTFNLYAKERGKVPPDELVDRMRKDIEIELVRDNHNELSAFNIYYSSRDASVAQQVTSELSSLFISENLEARQAQSENTTKFLETQLEEAARSLAEQEAKVRQYKDQHLGELPGQLQSNLQILAGLQSQLGTEEDALNRAKQQNAYLESLLGQYKSLQRSGKSGESAPIGLPALDKELDRLKAQLADLSSHYTDQHPDVRKVKEQIAKTEKMRQQVAASMAKASSDPAPTADSPKDAAEIRDMSPTFEMQSQLKANQIEITNRQHAIQELEGKIGGYQGRLNQSPVAEQQLTDLTRGYEQSRADYDSLLKKKNDSELASNMERQQQGEHFRILDPPSLPTKPFSPNRLKLFGIGLFAGLVLGGGFAAASELADGRLYTEKELKDLVGVDVIAEIPPLLTVDEHAVIARKTWHRWVGAGVISVCILVGFAITYLRG
jgi:succinoglycan biosynthesis transport protein ExoP